jgi:hypothetical protein
VVLRACVGARAFFVLPLMMMFLGVVRATRSADGPHRGSLAPTAYDNFNWRLPVESASLHSRKTKGGFCMVDVEGFFFCKNGRC